MVLGRNLTLQFPLKLFWRWTMFLKHGGTRGSPRVGLCLGDTMMGRGMSFIWAQWNFWIIFSRRLHFWTLYMKPLHGREWCFMGLWLGLRSVIRENTRIGGWRGMEWPCIMLPNAKLWSVKSTLISLFLFTFLELVSLAFYTNTSISFGNKIKI